MQIFVRLQGGRTRTLCFGSDEVQVSHLKKHIEDFEGIPCNEQRLACSQRELLDDAVLSGDDLLFVSLSLRVVGGKGGFGSLLRGAPSRIGQKKTDNFDACRDLSGRRLRHANNEKKLQEWIASAKEREMEQLALQHIKKAANQHKFDDEKYTHESEEIKESISTALERGIDEAKKSAVLFTSKKRPLESETTPGPLKRRQVWDDLDDIPDEESEPEAKEKKTKKATESSKTPHSPTTSTTITTTFTTSSSSSFPPSPSSTTSTTTTTTSTTSTTSHSEEEPTPSSPTPSSSSSTSSSSSPTPSSVPSPSSSSSLASSSSSSPTPSHTPVDLSKYETAKELEEIGGDALKAELQRLGLLCGGTVADRANRLFLLKTTPLYKLDKKHFAKKNKK